MKQNLPMLAALLTIAYAINSCSDKDVPDLPTPCGDFGYYDSETYYCYTELRQRCDSAGNCDVLYGTCYLAEKPGNSAYYVMTCGTTAAEWPKAMCEAMAYDPDTEICIGGKVYLIDVRDKKKYKIARIGEQTWMVENLNYNASSSKCYDNLESNCTTYGRLYDWATAMDSIQVICPSRWHIPSDAEWATLKAAIDWLNDGNGTDDYGFLALPGSDGGWWSATEDENDDNSAYRFDFKEGNRKHDKSDLFSIRCVKD
jgi:hypothetical protein